VTEVSLRWRLPPAVGDVLLAGSMTAVVVLGSYGESHPTNPADRVSHGHVVPAAPGWAYVLVAGAALVLVWRRHHPVPVLLASLAGVATYTGLGYVNGSGLLAPTVALYAVAVAVAWRLAVTWAVIALAVLAGFTAGFNPPAFGPFGGGFVLIPGLVAAALFAGLAVANRHAYVEAIRQRAELAERTREDEARRRVDAERLRIARELHDVVAHTMATINVQAGVAAHVSNGLPEQAATALQAIKEASRRGLRELRAILAVLHQADEDEPTHPAPGLAELTALISTVDAAGLPATIRIAGEQRPLPPAVDLAAYRIVQESLTNALRHAGPATATVALTFGPNQLQVEVVDTGRGDAASSDGAGHGIPGMRERAAAVGGTLQAGPGPGGGFRVLACLPIEEAQ
jgi:signal transduction histidine kinase